MAVNTRIYFEYCNFFFIQNLLGVRNGLYPSTHCRTIISGSFLMTHPVFHIFIRWENVLPSEKYRGSTNVTLFV